MIGGKHSAGRSGHRGRAGRDGSRQAHRGVPPARSARSAASATGATPSPLSTARSAAWCPCPRKILPVRLPEDIDLAAGETLATHAGFVNTTCPVCGGPAKRETDTMDTFTCSSWYYMRYTDPHNVHAPLDPEKTNAWMPVVDQYIGGIEHAVVQPALQPLLYESAARLRPARLRRALREPAVPGHGARRPRRCDEQVEGQRGLAGGDDRRIRRRRRARLHLVLGPPEKEGCWRNEDGLPGTYKFLNRLWRQVHDLCGEAGDETLVRAEAG